MTGRYCFHRCLSVNISGGGGVPGLRFSGGGGYLVSDFWGGGYLVSDFRKGGYPVSVKGKIFDSRFGLIHQTGEKKFLLRDPPPSAIARKLLWLHGGRYASCVHAGGLSCQICILLRDVRKICYRPHPKGGGRYCFQFVCQFTSRGGGVPGPGGGTRSQIRGGYPVSDLGGGVPSLSKGKNFWHQIWLDTCSDQKKNFCLGTAHPTPPPVNAKFFDTRFGLIHVQTGKKFLYRDTHTHTHTHTHTPPIVKGKFFDTRFGLIHVQTGEKNFCWGTPPPPAIARKLLWLHGGRYASCVHAGGLSCQICILLWDVRKICYRPHPKDGGRYCFQFVCQFTSRGGGPRSGGGYPVSDPGGGTQSQIWGVGYPVSVKGKIFDTRFGLIHVQTRKKNFV